MRTATNERMMTEGMVRIICCILRTYGPRHPVDPVFVSSRRARRRGDDRGADIKGDVCHPRKAVIRPRGSLPCAPLLAQNVRMPLGVFP